MWLDHTDTKIAAVSRRLLAVGLAACTHCQPDTVLGILDLSARPDLSTAAR